MSYLHLSNLYKDQTILMFREIFALEKIHGTSAHVSFEHYHNCVGMTFFNGGENRERFIALFNETELIEKFRALSIEKKMTVYGEAYGGKQQGMSDTYGKELKFVAFEVKIGDSWLDVPRAAAVVQALGLEFVDYVKIPTTLEAIDAERDKPSVQAVRNGVTEPKQREGVVLRPLIEVTKNNGERVIAKHKTEAFRETAKPRKVLSPEQLEVLTKAQEISDEWATPMRLQHVLGGMVDPQIEDTGIIIKAMLEDVKKESGGEIVWSHDAEKAIGKATSKLLKEYFHNKLRSVE